MFRGAEMPPKGDNVNTINKEQYNYILAKKELETINNKIALLEMNFIKNENIKNENGKTPTKIYEIESETDFDKANIKFEKIVEASGLWAKCLQAENTLKEAENKLIEYALSITPRNERRILQKSVDSGNYTIRKKLIELVIRLDISTVK